MRDPWASPPPCKGERKERLQHSALEGSDSANIGTWIRPRPHHQDTSHKTRTWSKSVLSKANSGHIYAPPLSGPVVSPPLARPSIEAPLRWPHARTQGQTISTEERARCPALVHTHEAHCHPEPCSPARLPPTLAALERTNAMECVLRIGRRATTRTKSETSRARRAQHVHK